MSPTIEWTLMVVGWTIILLSFSITRYKMVKVHGGMTPLKNDQMRKETMISNVVFLFYFIAAGIAAHFINLPPFIQYEHMSHLFHLYIGIFVFAAAIWLYIYSRITLGSNWSWKGELIRDKSKLIVCGPFCRIRHPNYTAYILAGFASGIVIAETRVLVFMVLMLPVIYWRALIDEKHLNEIFPEYKAYKKNTRMFF